ncbi:type II toxin-antitoxin system RnlA family toxin [Bacillus safensis]|uniref:type II toxin-antitoxin system RnlA family toxin n=1 Tax=Bacillus safensis TaxID=561879 RepID=UPI0022800F7B|nr:type II toxin-antitoxin system RnlA family toxin [Bacillus safensis]MCY7431769.1 type II toxin-antitoxin system RnlA family toxin [Bacillus safensis]
MSKGKKKNIFKGLMLDRDELPVWLSQVTANLLSESSVSEIYPVGNGGIQHRCDIKGDGKAFYLDFYFNGDGTTTIQPMVGPAQHQSINVQIAAAILGFLNFNNQDAKGRSYSVQPLERDDFELVIEYLDSLEGNKQLEKIINETNKYTMYKYRSRIGDKMTLIYYDNKRLQIQGKPAYLYQEVTSLLSQYFPFDEVVKKQGEFFSVDLNPVEIRQEMEEQLPDVYADLDDTLKKILSASFALQQIDIELEDYSCFAFPALRVLEGYLKGILLKKGIIVGKSGFSDFFDKLHNKYVLNSDKRAKIGCSVTASCVENLYNYYNRQRHGLFHAEAVASGTRILATRDSAEKIIADVVSLINTTHNDIASTSVN